MRKCRHHYEWYDGKLKCARCGHRKWLTRGAKRKIGKASILVILVIGGFFVYQNYGMIFNKVQTEIPRIDQSPYTKPLIAKLTSLSANLSQVVTNSNIQLAPLSLDQLQKITLDDINKYRQENNIPDLSLVNEPPSQTYAELLLSENCLHHMNDNGLTPQGRFHQAGLDSFAIGENIAGGQKAVLEDLGGFIKARNYDMMFNDADSNWGHKKNILDPQYTSISIGIAYNNLNMVVVEDFESPLQSNEYIPSSAYFDTPDKKDCW
ncbi:MAG: CAP domain-containing protein [Nitrosotalea sp.]